MLISRLLGARALNKTNKFEELNEIFLVHNDGSGESSRQEDQNLKYIKGRMALSHMLVLTYSEHAIARYFYEDGLGIINAISAKCLSS